MRETGLVALTFPGSGQPVQCDGVTTGQWPVLGATSTRLGRARGAGSWLVWLPVSWVLELQKNLGEV